MSFLPPTGTPFSLVQAFPTVNTLSAAIQAGIASGVFAEAPPSGTIPAPDRTLIVGGGAPNNVTVVSTPGDPSDILVTGAGTRLNIVGPADVQGTNLGGGGIIIETVQGDASTGGGGTNTPDFSPKRIDFSSSYASPAGEGGEGVILVDTTQLVGGNLSYLPQQTILEASGGLASNITFYAHGGSGNDLLIGSAANDFLRGGAGDDSINAGPGNDIVRGGSGFDTIELGTGLDSLYYTIDQIDSEDFIADFTTGEDKIFFDSPIISAANVNIVGDKVIEVTVDDRFLKIISGKDNFQQSDINFV